MSVGGRREWKTGDGKQETGHRQHVNDLDHINGHRDQACSYVISLHRFPPNIDHFPLPVSGFLFSIRFPTADRGAPTPAVRRPLQEKATRISRPQSPHLGPGRRRAPAGEIHYVMTLISLYVLSPQSVRNAEATIRTPERSIDSAAP
jgi:hypothetical protein